MAEGLLRRNGGIEIGAEKGDRKGPLATAFPVQKDLEESLGLLKDQREAGEGIRRKERASRRDPESWLSLPWPCPAKEAVPCW